MRAQCVVTGALFVWIVGVTFVNVSMRYVFTRSIVWADEAARLSFIVFSFLGAAVAVAARSHLAIPAFVERLPNKARTAVVVASAMAAIALFGLLVIGGWRQASVNLAQASPALRIPIGYVYMAIPISGLIMLMNLVGTWLYGPYPLPKPAEEIAAEEIAAEDFDGGAVF